MSSRSKDKPHGGGGESLTPTTTISSSSPLPSCVDELDVGDGSGGGESSGGRSSDCGVSGHPPNESTCLPLTALSLTSACSDVTDGGSLSSTASVRYHPAGGLCSPPPPWSAPWRGEREGGAWRRAGDHKATATTTAADGGRGDDGRWSGGGGTAVGDEPRTSPLDSWPPASARWACRPSSARRPRQDGNVHGAASPNAPVSYGGRSAKGICDGLWAADPAPLSTSYATGRWEVAPVSPLHATAAAERTPWELAIASGGGRNGEGRGKRTGDATVTAASAAAAAAAQDQELTRRALVTWRSRRQLPAKAMAAAEPGGKGDGAPGIVRRQFETDGDEQLSAMEAVAMPARKVPRGRVFVTRKYGLDQAGSRDDAARRQPVDHPKVAVSGGGSGGGGSGTGGGHGGCDGQPVTTAGNATSSVCHCQRTCGGHSNGDAPVGERGRPLTTNVLAAPSSSRRVLAADDMRTGAARDEDVATRELARGELRTSSRSRTRRVRPTRQLVCTYDELMQGSVAQLPSPSGRGSGSGSRGPRLRRTVAVDRDDGTAKRTVSDWLPPVSGGGRINLEADAAATVVRSISTAHRRGVSTRPWGEQPPKSWGGYPRRSLRGEACFLVGNTTTTAMAPAAESGRSGHIIHTTAATRQSAVVTTAVGDSTGAAAEPPCCTCRCHGHDGGGGGGGSGDGDPPHGPLHMRRRAAAGAVTTTTTDNGGSAGGGGSGVGGVSTSTLTGSIGSDAGGGDSHQGPAPSSTDDFSGSAMRAAPSRLMGRLSGRLPPLGRSSRLGNAVERLLSARADGSPPTTGTASANKAGSPASPSPLPLPSLSPLSPTLRSSLATAATRGRWRWWSRSGDDPKAPTEAIVGEAATAGTAATRTVASTATAGATATATAGTAPNRGAAPGLPLPPSRGGGAGGVHTPWAAPATARDLADQPPAAGGRRGLEGTRAPTRSGLVASAAVGGDGAHGQRRDLPAVWRDASLSSVAMRALAPAQVAAAAAATAVAPTVGRQPSSGSEDNWGADVDDWHYFQRGPGGRRGNTGAGGVKGEDRRGRVVAGPLELDIQAQQGAAVAAAATRAEAASTASGRRRVAGRSLGLRLASKGLGGSAAGGDRPRWLGRLSRAGGRAVEP